MREEYFLDRELWGANRITLKDVIDRIIIEAKDDDSFIKNADRGHLILLSKRALREIGYTTNFLAKGLKVTVPSSLMIPVEEDFSELIRASVIDNCKLFRIKENTGSNKDIASYLQDCKGDLIFDGKGQIFDSCSNVMCVHENKVSECNNCTKCSVSTEDKYRNSSIEIVNGAIIFSHDLEDKEVFIEYLSNEIMDSLDECNIRIKEIFEEGIIYYVYWKYLERRVNTSNRANTFRDLYQIELSRIKRNERMANVTANTIKEYIGNYR